jgi:hypothetical protein
VIQVGQVLALTVAINGTAQEGQTLTAVPSGAVTGYQWQELISGTWTPISGASNSTYILQESAEGLQIRIEVTSTSGSADSAATAAVTDATPTLSVALNGNAVEGATLTATPTLGTDGDNSVADVTYQWQRNGNAISGATGSTYLVGEADEGAQITVMASFTDDTGQSVQATSNASGPVLDAPPTVSTPVITGIAQEGQTLTASANAGQSDNAVAYQWFSSADGYTNPIGSGASYQVKEGDEGNQIEVVATVTNDNGATVSATSTATAKVTEAPPSLSVTVSGTAQEKQTLTAVPIASSGDAVIEYQWQVLNGTSWGNITAATSSTYVVTEANETHQLRVIATMTDTDGGGATATSAASTAVIDAAPTVTTPAITGAAQEGKVLTASASSGQSDNPLKYQWMENSGPLGAYQNIVGATSVSYTVKEADEGYAIEVVATATNGNGVTVSATSSATGGVLDAAPSVTTPIITGVVQEGSTHRFGRSRPVG